MTTEVVMLNYEGIWYFPRLGHPEVTLGTGAQESGEIMARLREGCQVEKRLYTGNRGKRCVGAKL